MYNEKFMNELFKPQAVYSNHSTRQIFSRLAHSSIMRLNTASMEKLYDLMTMGFKYQLLTIPHPRHLLDVTVNHMNTIMNIIKGETKIVSVVEASKQRFIKLYNDFTDGDFYMLKHVLCRFFQGRRVKVSLFLQDHIQNLDGSIILDASGQLPKGTDVPGTIRHFTADGKASGTSTIQIINSEKVQPFKNITTALGGNLYSKERKPSSSSSSSDKSKDSKPKKPTEPVEEPTIISESGKAEMNLLADLIGTKDASVTGEKLKIDLFAAKDPYGSAIGKGGAADRTADIILIDTAEGKKAACKELEKLYGMNIEETYDEKVDDEDDLLALMDSAK